MADQAVGELIQAQSIGPTDLFVLEQSGVAKCLKGQILLNWLTAAADGHGGIKSIEKTDTTGLVDTYTITLADETTYNVAVKNGRGITDFAKTETSGLLDTYTITYNDGSTGKITVKNGEKGDSGDNAYTWVKYASQEPTEESHSMGDVPDAWRGEYNGNSPTAPTDWKQYKWYKIKGDKGDTGDPADLVRNEVSYQSSDSGEIIPSGEWSTAIPVVAQGKFLWTRTITQYNSGDPIRAYSVARMGIDGLGSVSSVNDVSPDANGNVKLGASDVGALADNGGDLSGELRMHGQPISGLNDPTDDAQAANKGYVDTVKRDLLAQLSWGNILTVGANNCQFPTINAAIDHAKQSCTAQNRFLVLVTNGTYYERINLVPNPGIDFIGLGNVYVVDDTAYPEAPLHTIGQGYFENITFLQPNSDVSSYACHIEAQESDTAGKIVLKDCDFVSNGSAGIGIGTGNGQEIVVDGCRIISNHATSAALYFHNFPAATETCSYLSIVNCQIESDVTNVVADCASKLHGSDDSALVVKFVGCVLSGNTFVYRTSNDTSALSLPLESNDIVLSPMSNHNSYGLLNYADAGARSVQFVPASIGDASIIMYQNADLYDWTISSIYAYTASGQFDVTATASVTVLDYGLLIRDTSGNVATAYNVTLSRTPK